MEVTEEHKVFQVSTVYFQARKVHTRRNASVGPGAACSDDEAGPDDWGDHHTRPPTPSADGPTMERERPVQDFTLFRPGRHYRRLSADNSFFQRVPVSHEELSIAPTPPYSPFPISPSSPSSERPPTGYDSPTTNHAAQTLEDFRNSLNAGLRNYRSE
jgi:hypothetical protein